jgi:hypothetical protein
LHATPPHTIIPNLSPPENPPLLCHFERREAPEKFPERLFGNHLHLNKFAPNSVRIGDRPVARDDPSAHPYPWTLDFGHPTLSICVHLRSSCGLKNYETLSRMHAIRDRPAAYG